MKPVALTKIRFVKALQCPRKLQYERDSRYLDTSADDEFLESLAEGGHQVGELARKMFPQGHLITEASPEEQVRTTRSLLERQVVSIFEATIRYGNLLVRCDVLQRTGNRLDLIEVKAKGFNPHKDSFLSSRGDHPVRSTWRPYLYDIAYQAYVLSCAYPQFAVVSSLLLLDKTVVVPIPGLNSSFAVTL